MNSLDVTGLTDDSGEFATSGVQYAVITPDGKLHLDGDQEWVKDGRALNSYLGGTVLCRDVTIMYGPWRDLAVAESEDMAAEYRERLIRMAASAAEFGRAARAQITRLADPTRDSADARTALDEIVARLIGMGEEVRRG